LALRLRIESLKFIKIVVIIIIIVQSLVLAYSMRPIQDDYFNLQSVQQMGVLGYLEDTWLRHGGNMIQFLIHCIVILPTTQSFVFWNLGLFFLLTQLLCFWAIRIALNWLLPNSSKTLLFWIPLFSLAGFEGLFVPGFLGTFGFSLATLAHLWPVMALIIGLLALRLFPGSWFVAFLLGLVAGNSNLGESAFAIGALFFLLVSRLTVADSFNNFGIKINRNFYSLFVGTLLGTIGIVAAPGFWNRASDQVGLPTSLSDFFFRLAKSFASFTADALTHPMIWVFFFLGVVYASRIVPELSTAFRLRFRIISIGSGLIWLALVFGSTFAYPSWHQSMGMYLLLFPTSFAAGLFVNNQHLKRAAVGLLALSSFVMLITFVRIGVLGVSRSQAWDQNLIQNICALKVNSAAELEGAEIRYPPFDLGVEDVNTWKWMRDKYVGWVDAIPNNIDCD
jgi:uncharacterized membrane protein YiaA